MLVLWSHVCQKTEAVQRLRVLQLSSQTVGDLWFIDITTSESLKKWTVSALSNTDDKLMMALIINFAVQSGVALFLPQLPKPAWWQYFAPSELPSHSEDLKHDVGFLRQCLAHRDSSTAKWRCIHSTNQWACITLIVGVFRQLAAWTSTVGQATTSAFRVRYRFVKPAQSKVCHVEMELPFLPILCTLKLALTTSVTSALTRHPATYMSVFS